MRAGAVLRKRKARAQAVAAALLVMSSAVAQQPGPGDQADSAGTASAPPAEAPESDHGTAPDGGIDDPAVDSGESEDDDLPFAGTLLSLENSVTAQTLGFGADYQSRNPTYDVQLALRARYVLWKDGNDRVLALGGRVALIRELTSSDTTTDQGEWNVSGADLTDADLVLNYAHELAEDGLRRTVLGTGFPILSFPTSKVSRANGKIFGTGLSVGLTHVEPLREDQKLLPSTHFRARAGYTYQFTRAVVGVDDGLQRIRLDPLGRSMPSDQLNGAALSQHQLVFSGLAGLDISKVVALEVGLGWLVAYNYALSDDVEICNVATGCVLVEEGENPPNATVSSLFQTVLTIDAPEPVGFSLAYENLAGQIGPDGSRRNLLYSPDARVVLSLHLKLHELYKTVSPSQKPRQAARSSSTMTDARRSTSH